MSWQTLGAVAPRELVDARPQLYHAAQLVASAGVIVLAPQAERLHDFLDCAVDASRRALQD